MQLSFVTILLASGFSLEGSNATTQFLGRSSVSLVEEQIRAATPRRLTHRRTVDGLRDSARSGGPGLPTQCAAADPARSPLRVGVHPERDHVLGLHARR